MSRVRRHERKLAAVIPVSFVCLLAMMITQSCDLPWLPASETALCEDTGLRCPSGTQCTRDGMDCIPVGSACGNGNIDSGEECDDGNRTPDDGCSAACERELCVDRGEDDYCDSRGRDTEDCDSDCTLAECGDGHVNPLFKPDGDRHIEQCDDGNNENHDACPSGPGSGDEPPGNCQFAVCGDKIKYDGMEYCDSGGIDTMMCDSDCTVPECGDGHLNSVTEQCDDGNEVNGDACPSGPGRDDEPPGDCKLAHCGDGIKYEDMEFCDKGGVDMPSCDDDCTEVKCGDSHVNEAAGEECDDGNHFNFDACPDGDGPPEGTCKKAFCGDGFINIGVEECDRDSNGDAIGCQGTDICVTSDNSCICGEA